MDANNDIRLEAAGFDSNQSATIDADAAFALQLQQEEYSRESLVHPRYRQFPYPIDPDDESGDSNQPVFLGFDTPRFHNDEDLATFLQERESAQRSRYHQLPFRYRPMRERPHGASNQTSEGNADENGPSALARPPGLPVFRPDDDEDDEDGNEHTRVPVELFRQFFENFRHPMAEGGPRYHPGFRRGRRTGNLQDTEDDFGPEDYEVIPRNFFDVFDKFFSFSSVYFN